MLEEFGEKIKDVVFGYPEENSSKDYRPEGTYYQDVNEYLDNWEEATERREARIAARIVAGKDKHGES